MTREEMNYEEKQLLLKDLSARLPYGVKIQIYDDYSGMMKNEKLNVFHLDSTYSIEYRKLRPYLRPMSSMTEEELKWYYNKLTTIEESRIRRQKHIEELNDWINAHHFDYRGLIDKGLALEAPEGMYKTE